MRKHLREPLVPPDHINTSLTAGVSEVIEIMMAKRKKERYKNIEELLTDLEAIRDGQPPLRARDRFDLSAFKQLEDGDAVELEEDVYKQEIAQRYRMVLLLLGTVAGIAILIVIVILYEARKWVDLKRIWPLMIAGIVGMPFGTYLLIFLKASTLKVLIGSVIVLFALALLKGFKRKIKSEKLAFAPVGFISGLLAGSTMMGGPPVILFFTNQGLNKNVFRANIVCYFATLSLATIPAYVAGGLITKEVIKYAILLLPAMICGGITGIKLAHIVQEQLFKKIVLIILIVAGLMSIVSGFGLC